MRKNVILVCRLLKAEMISFNQELNELVTYVGKRMSEVFQIRKQLFNFNKFLVLVVVKPTFERKHVGNLITSAALQFLMVRLHACLDIKCCQPVRLEVFGSYLFDVCKIDFVLLALHDSDTTLEILRLHHLRVDLKCLFLASVKPITHGWLN